MFTIYILQSQVRPNRTYVGATTNFARRLRQHNGQIAGGAKSTRAFRPWQLRATITGFPTRTAMLQFEYQMHHPPQVRKGIQGRLMIAQTLLAQEQWSNCELNIIPD